MVRLFYEDSKKFLEKKWFDFKFSPKVIHNRMQQLFKFKFNHCLSEESVSVYMYFLFMQTACRISILQVIRFSLVLYFFPWLGTTRILKEYPTHKYE